MPLRQFVDSGGEYLLPFAKKKILFLHSLMAGAGPRSLHRTILTDASSTIYLDSVRVKPGVFLDTIRITAGGKYLVGITMPDPTPYRSLYLVEDGADHGIAHTSGIFARMSDGTAVATQPQSRIGGGSSGDGTIATPWVYGQWSGGEFFDLYDNIRMFGDQMTGGTFLGKLSFSVPADTNTANAFRETLGPRANALIFVGAVIGGLSVADDARYLADATAGFSLVAPREKLRLQNNSTAAVNMLRAGVMPVLGTGSWGALVKSSALDSTKPRATSPFTAALSTAEVPSFTALGTPGTVYGPTTVTRGVDLSYVDASGAVQSANVTGTWTQQSIKVGSSFYVTNTYSDFPVFSPTTGASLFSLPAVDTGPMSDTSAVLGSIVSGASTVGYNGDSTFGPASNPAAFPGIPASSAALTFVTAPLYAQYLAALRPVSVDSLAVDPGYSANWLSTSMVASETVTLVPFSPVTAGEDLGMFASKVGATQVATYGYANFRYNADGTFTFVNWHDAPAVTDMLDSAGSAITWPVTNCIVKYTKFPYKDVQATATAQATALTNPVTQANKFLALIERVAGI